MAGLLAACGGGKDATPRHTAAPAASASPTAPPAAARNLPTPQVEPHQFEAPFAVGLFTRQRLFGKADAVQSGGQQAVYKSDDGTVVLNVYYFPTPEEAMRTVQFTLEAGSVEMLIGEPYFTPSVSFGAARDANGGYVVAWSQGRWAYIARTGDSARVLDEFLALFPY